MPDEKVKKTSIEGEFDIPVFRLKNLKWKTNFTPPTKKLRKEIVAEHQRGIDE